MLTDPQTIINRIKRYPNLKDFVSQKWVQTAIARRTVAIWHPFFEDDEPSSDQIISNLDTAISYLLREGVTGTRTRAQKLCAMTEDNFWSAFTELILGTKLRKEYPMRYLPENGPRAPDIEVTTSSGPVYVEITAMHKTRDFHAIPQYIHAALDGLQHSYRIRVECHSDAIKLSKELLNELAEQVKIYITAEPYPYDRKSKRVFRSGNGHVSVDLLPSNGDNGHIVTSTVGGGSPRPDAYFGQIMRRLEEKASQVAGYSPCVAVIELAHGVGNVVMLGALDSTWEAYSPLFRLDEIPTEVDLVILTWQSIFGETWGHARVLRNPNSLWAQSPDAERIYQLIAEPPHMLSNP